MNGPPLVRPPRRWLWWLFLLAATLGAVYCGFGVIMAADFSVACDVRRPEDCAHWRAVAIVYEWLVLGFLTAVAAASVVLLRSRRARQASGPGARAA